MNMKVTPRTCLIIVERLDAVQENEENGSDVTLYDLDQDLDEISSDNGFESPEEEHYRNFPFFPT